MRLFDFFMLVPIEIRVAGLNLRDVIAHCLGRLREIVPFRLDPFFEWIPLLANGLEEVVTEFEEWLAIRLRRETEKETQKDRP